jgi:hypothetical protein
MPGVGFEPTLVVLTRFKSCGYRDQSKHSYEYRASERQENCIQNFGRKILRKQTTLMSYAKMGSILKLI